jgi:hypothetical protein
MGKPNFSDEFNRGAVPQITERGYPPATGISRDVWSYDFVYGRRDDGRKFRIQRCHADLKQYGISRRTVRPVICPTEWTGWFVSGLSPPPPYPSGGGAKRNRRLDRAVKPFLVPVVGSQGCCAGGRCCNAAARLGSAPLPRRGCRRSRH